MFQFLSRILSLIFSVVEYQNMMNAPPGNVVFNSIDDFQYAVTSRK